MTRDGMVIGTFSACLEWPLRVAHALVDSIGSPTGDGIRAQGLSGGQVAPKSARTWGGTVWSVGGQPTAADPGPATTAQAPPESWA
jgi:hypothetical protein